MRWQHLLAVGPFDQGGEVELATLRMHHAGGKIEFYRPDFETGELEIAASVSGYTTHRIYSRNLDMARAVTSTATALSSYRCRTSRTQN
ncbi:MAG TPA: hypothetical protein VKA51_06370 [Rubrobacteraceae bacterium]|nr:hypothetical protein [Rubrobacteraceae bacterium]